jgi:hypothetical protein
MLFIMNIDGDAILKEVMLFVRSFITPYANLG